MLVGVSSSLGCRKKGYVSLNVRLSEVCIPQFVTRLHKVTELPADFSCCTRYLLASLFEIFNIRVRNNVRCGAE